MVASNLLAQSTADAPVTNFRLPVFNAEGNRIFDLSSAAVRPLSEKPVRLELTTVHVRMYAPGDAPEVVGELFTPSAVYDQATQQVSGPGQLHAIYRDIELFGNDWVYDAPSKSIVIKHDVVVTFPGELGQLLR
jgi:hypothetical protein